MQRVEILNEYKKQDDKILLSHILDKIEISKKKQEIQVTDFLDMYQIVLVRNFLKKINFSEFIFNGGFENSERKVAIFYPENIEEDEVNQEFLKKCKIIRITLPEEEKGKYVHRNYLGGIIKLGIKREKVGDILVFEDGADIVVKEETAQILANELQTLTRFSNSILQVKEISEIRKPEIKKEEINIIVPSLRLDNIVSDLARTSRNKAVQILNQERVFVNGQNETKPSKNIKVNDIITIRGKGRFVIKEIVGTTRSGRTVLRIEKFV